MTNPITLQGYSYPLTRLADVIAAEARQGREVRIAIQHAGGWTVSPEMSYSDYNEPWSKDFLDLKITPDEKASVCSCRECMADDDGCPVHGHSTAPDRLTLCPDCSEPWPATETVRADGSLGCSCQELETAAGTGA